MGINCDDAFLEKRPGMLGIAFDFSLFLGGPAGLCSKYRISMIRLRLL